MYYNYKYRLYPTEEQVDIMNHHMEIHRWTYNHFLEIINRDGLLPRSILSSDLPYLKDRIQEDKFGNKYDLNDANAQALTYTLQQLYSNINRLSGTKKKNKKNLAKGEYSRVKKIGKLRFKSKDKFKSFSYRGQGFDIIYEYKAILVSNCPMRLYVPKRLQKLRLSKIGDIPIRLHRNIPNGYIVKKVTIKKYPSGEWCATLSIQQDSEKKTKDERIEELRKKAREDKERAKEPKEERITEKERILELRRDYESNVDNCQIEYPSKKGIPKGYWIDNGINPKTASNYT